jgi:aspartyl-tRNA synthetase
MDVRLYMPGQGKTRSGFPTKLLSQTGRKREYYFKRLPYKPPHFPETEKVPSMPQYRTHTCCELRKTDVDKEVTLSGWIHSRRDHGGVLFIDLRDNYGLTQVVIYPTRTFLDEVSRLPKETVIRFVGKVAFRSDENVNPKLPTGEIEVAADSYEVLGACDPLPLNVFPEDDAPEDLRLTYRFLDLRRSKLHRNLGLRSDVIASMRRRMWELGFKEFQTPIP